MYILNFVIVSWSILLRNICDFFTNKIGIPSCELQIFLSTKLESPLRGRRQDSITVHKRVFQLLPTDAKTIKECRFSKGFCKLREAAALPL
jgi:hypothetical protein